MCGLCGNFDGNVNNDMMSSNNQLEVDSSHFGNSWKVVPSCADVRQVNSGLSLVFLYFFLKFIMTYFVRGLTVVRSKSIYLISS